MQSGRFAARVFALLASLSLLLASAPAAQAAAPAQEPAPVAPTAVDGIYSISGSIKTSTLLPVQGVNVFATRTDLEPLIFIPGVGGSVLQMPGKPYPLWPNVLAPDSSFETLVRAKLGDTQLTGVLLGTLGAIQNEMAGNAGNLALAQNNGSYASDAIRWVVNAGPVKLKDIYGSLLESYFPSQGYIPYPLENLSATNRPGTVCNTGLSPKPTLFVFPYDWRKSNSEAATQLATYISCIQQIHPDKKINILAHSMGGLVARRYILEQGGQPAQIHRVITLGTPWLGAPKLINSAFTGAFDEDTNMLLVNRETLAPLVKTWPGALELLPSARYYSLTGGDYPPPFVEAGWDFNGKGSDHETYDYDTYRAAMNAKLPGGMDLIEAFHSGGQDAWSNNIGGVEYHTITGAGRDTILQITAKNVCVLWNTVCANERFLVRTGPNMFNVGLNWYGDGTVPTLSGEGSRIANLGSGVQKFYNFHPAINPLSDEFSHGNLPNAADVRTCISAILAGATCTPSSAATADVAAAAESYQILIVGAGSALVSDAQGRQSGMVAGILRVDNIPGVGYFDTGGNAVQIDAPASEPLTVTFQSGPTSLYIEILKGSGGTATAATRYLDVQVPANSTLTLHLPLPASNALLYDATGDGVAETPVAQPPVVAPSPAAAADNTPPVVALVVDASTAPRRLVATAQDVSGIKTTWYTLDGATYAAYTGPVGLPANATGTAHAFADDNVGNRSAVVDLAWSGGATPDTTPPVVTLAIDRTTNPARLVVTAQDPSGVKAIWYTLDGPTFLAYTAPVALPAGGSGTAHAYADDTLGNRSTVKDLAWTGGAVPQQHIYLPTIKGSPGGAATEADVQPVPVTETAAPVAEPPAPAPVPTSPQPAAVAEVNAPAAFYAQTDVQGNYTIAFLPAGTYEVRAQSSSYSMTPVMQTVVLPTSGPVNFTATYFDAAEMVLIPAGSFQMGCSPDDPECDFWESPLHIVTLDAYAIDKYEVTNARYAKCVAAGECTVPHSTQAVSYLSGSYEYYGVAYYANFPVIDVDWNQATAFCASEGKRLPSEAEWEKAARGSSDTRIHPWGNTATNCTRANFFNSGTYCVGESTAVGSYPTGGSPYGVLDMSGNVWEWVNDWWRTDYYLVSPPANPQGPPSGDLRVLRGDGWSSGGVWDQAGSARISGRYENVPTAWDTSLGLRCVRSQ